MSLTMAAACGGGGGGGGGGGNTAPTTAIVTLATSGTLPAGVDGIGAIDITLALPAGVTVAATNQVTDSGVVTASGTATGAIAFGTYTAATTTIPATVRVMITSSSAGGFGTGEFATVNCILNGTSPADADFTVLAESFQAVGIIVSTNSTTTITSSLTPGMTVELQ
ncbi:MAG: hypothetical protein OEW15_13960 [Nitrospirota bacterium]|nr:hypothetical protein [Nitrospirota bacterium]